MNRPILLVFAVLVLFSCKQDEVSTSDGILNVAVKKDPQLINPLVYNGGDGREVFQYIFTPVGDYDPVTQQLEPIIIEQIPESRVVTGGPRDGMIAYDIRIKDEARWSDGKPITGYDYVFTLKTIKHPETATTAIKAYISDLVDAEVDPKDDKKVTVYFDEYYMLSVEVVASMYIYPRHIYDPMGALKDVSMADLQNESKVAEVTQRDTTFSAFARAFNSIKYGRDIVEGPGPYRLKEWVTNQIVVLERKSDYWGANSDISLLKAGPKEIVFNIMADEASIANQIKAGEIDFYANVSQGLYDELQTADQYKDKFAFLSTETPRLFFISINNMAPEFQNKASRRALAHLVDVDEIINLVAGGKASRATVPFFVKKAYYDKSLRPIPFDIEEAKRILANDGWKDTNANGILDKVVDGKLTEYELDMMTTGSKLSQSIALIVQKNAEKAGVKINIFKDNFTKYRKEVVEKGKYDMFTTAFSQSLTLDDPYSKWHSDNSRLGGSNYSYYKSAEADELIDKIRDSRDQVEREKLYKKLQNVMYDDQPAIFLYYSHMNAVLSDDWSGHLTPKRPGYFVNTFTPKG